MFDLINRIRNFDIRKLTPLQWGMIAVGVIVSLWVLSTLISLATTLMPFVILGGLAFLGYRVLSSRGQDARDLQNAKREENIKQATLATDKAAQKVDTLIATKVGVVTDKPSRLSVEQVVNPETGFKEPDMSRLLAEEENKLKQAKQVDQDEIQRQLEERKKRLLGGQ